MTRINGTVKWFNARKGIGFITPDDGSADVFVHHSSLKCEGFKSVKDGSAVEFVLGEDDQGRPKALDVTGPDGDFVEPAPPPPPREGGFGGRGGFRGGRGGFRGGRGGGFRDGGFRNGGGYGGRDGGDRDGGYRNGGGYRNEGGFRGDREDRVERYD